MPEEAPVNIGALLERPYTVRQRVLGIQTKLHSWAAADPGRCFDDLFNLVVDPGFLVMAWTRVRENKGAKTAGIDGATAWSVENSERGVAGFLTELRTSLKDRSFRPVPVRTVSIPKANGKRRRLGIPTLRDRVVQASLKLVLEPILEADFDPSSYGFRPERRCQDAIEEIRFYAARGYEQVFEGDIAACFDEISHPALMDRLRLRVTDRRILLLVKAFLKAGLLDELNEVRDTTTGTPQGGILSPLLANLALSVLDEHFRERWRAMGNQTQRWRATRRGAATYRTVRYADDFVVMVFGTRQQAEDLYGEIETVLATVGLRLAPEKTQVVGIDEGFDFLGFRIQRHRQKGSDRKLIYTPTRRRNRGTPFGVRSRQRPADRPPACPRKICSDFWDRSLAAGRSISGTARRPMRSACSTTTCGGGSGVGYARNIRTGRRTGSFATTMAPADGGRKRVGSRYFNPRR